MTGPAAAVEDSAECRRAPRPPGRLPCCRTRTIRGGATATRIHFTNGRELVVAGGLEDTHRALRAEGGDRVRLEAEGSGAVVYVNPEHITYMDEGTPGDFRAV